MFERRWGVSLSCLLLCAACASPPPDVNGNQCVDTSDCDTGQACVGTECLEICSRDSDCTGSTEVCRNEVCVENDAAECQAPVDCTSPGSCETAVDPTCVGGVCQYAPRPASATCDDNNPCTEADECDGDGRCIGAPAQCDSPPANECTDADSTFVSYPSTGVCDTSDGECVYAPTETPCTDCATACLDACSGVTCEDENGGCRTLGTCTPGSPPTCSYSDAAADTPCDRPGSLPGALDGICDAGACVGCSDADQCVSPPTGDISCFDATCDAGVCNYAARAADSCAAEECIDGFVYAARVCGAAGDCPVPSPPGDSCDGFACDGSGPGSGCLSSCGGNQDCAGGLQCNAGVCESPRALGAICGSGGECASGFCDDGVCCESVCGGSCERCNMPGFEGTCTPNDNACLGSCSECDSGTGNCVAAPGDCAGNCSTCAGGGDTFNCLAVPGLCGGNCSSCEDTGDGVTFSCTGDVGQCNGDCVACLGNGTNFTCSTQAGACPGDCAVCSGGGDTFNCAADNTQCATCLSCIDTGPSSACQNIGAGLEDPGRCEAPGACDGGGSCLLPDGATGCTNNNECISGHCDLSSTIGPETGRCCGAGDCCDSLPLDDVLACGPGNYCQQSIFQCVTGSTTCDDNDDCLSICCDINTGTGDCEAPSPECICRSGAFCP